VVHAERRRGRSRTRVLYWFRTPPGVKVGRTALDEEALRRIEQQNPDLEFDWPRILKGGGSPPTEPRPPFERRSGVRPQTRSAPVPRPDRGLTPETAKVEVPEGPAAANGGQTPVDFQTVATELRGLTPEEYTIPEGLPEGTPAHEKLGAEGVQRLRQRYADVRGRIGDRITDPARRAELMAAAERINPDAWTSTDEVASALEQYESVLATLREVAGRKRRRRKRGGKRSDTDAPQASADATTSADDDSDADDDSGGAGDSGSGDS
jgi:hypothetical protein